MTRKKVNSIAIIGGGSAGWISACLLNAILNYKAHVGQTAQQNCDPKNRVSDPVKITVIEAPNIPSIGVGEATVPTIRQTLLTIGIPEMDMMRATNASFKSLIRFKDWNIGGQYDHPFDARNAQETDALLWEWAEQGNDPKEFSKHFSALSNMADRNLAPKAMDWLEYGSQFSYAYHLDAIKLAHLLADHGMAHGIERQLSEIQSSTIDGQGNITAVIGDEGQEYSADLFVDCTGFRALLAKLIMPKQKNYRDVLPCDRAVTMQVPYTLHRPSRIIPYTVATARSCGWSWDINLQNRRGIGYVYDSQHQNRQSAERELRRAEGGHCADQPIRHIEFETFKRKQAWRANCVAIGLSDGFVEPLESSGLYLIEFAAKKLANLLRSDREYGPSTARLFSQTMQAQYDEVVDFIAVHYQTSTRRDTPFWRSVTNRNNVSQALADRLEAWSRRPPLPTDFDQASHLFSVASYEYILFGMGHVKSQRNVKQQASNTASNPMQNMMDQAVKILPPHEAWLNMLGRTNDANQDLKSA